jgi:hypothetical protein
MQKGSYAASVSPWLRSAEHMVGYSTRNYSSKNTPTFLHSELDSIWIATCCKTFGWVPSRILKVLIYNCWIIWLVIYFVLEIPIRLLSSRCANKRKGTNWNSTIFPISPSQRLYTYKCFCVEVLVICHALNFLLTCASIFGFKVCLPNATLSFAMLRDVRLLENIVIDFKLE